MVLGTGKVGRVSFDRDGTLEQFESARHTDGRL